MRRVPGILAAIFLIFTASSGAVTDIAGREDITFNVTSQSEPTDYNGQFAEKSGFYFIKFKHDGNYFSINLPAGSFERLPEERVKRLVVYVTALYDDVFGRFKKIFGYIPEGYRLNMTFGRTSSNGAFNRMMIPGRTSNIFTNFLPYGDGKDVMTSFQRELTLHEISHSAFGILIGNLEHPKTRAIEEGFIDYIIGRETCGYRYKITEDQARNMEGLTQLDVEVSIWGRDIPLSKREVKGYIGLTHHTFGLAFIRSFADVFGADKLPEFLKRLKAAENRPTENDFGTGMIRDILGKMGFSGQDTGVFERKLHEDLRNGIFETVSG